MMGGPGRAGGADDDGVSRSLSAPPPPAPLIPPPLLAPPVSEAVAASVAAATAVVVGAAAAVDAQAMAMASLVDCGRGKGGGGSGYRALSPFALEDSCGGVLAGNAIVLCIVVIASAALTTARYGLLFRRRTNSAKSSDFLGDRASGGEAVGSPKSGRRALLPSALALAKTPSILLMSAAFFVNSGTVCGTQLLRGGGSPSSLNAYEAVAGAAAWIFVAAAVAVNPLLAYLFCSRRLLYVEYYWPPTRLSSSSSVSPSSRLWLQRLAISFLLPQSQLDPADASPAAFGSVVGSYRRLGPLWTLTSLATAIAALPIVFAPGGSPACAPLFSLSACLFFTFAVVVAVGRPRHTPALDGLHVLALAGNGALMAVSAALLSDPSPPTAENLRIASEAIGYFLTFLAGARAVVSLLSFAVRLLALRGIIGGVRLRTPTQWARFQRRKEEGWEVAVGGGCSTLCVVCSAPVSALPQWTRGDGRGGGGALAVPLLGGHALVHTSPTTAQGGGGGRGGGSDVPDLVDVAGADDDSEGGVEMASVRSSSSLDLLGEPLLTSDAAEVLGTAEIADDSLAPTVPPFGDEGCGDSKSGFVELATMAQMRMDVPPGMATPSSFVSSEPRPMYPHLPSAGGGSSAIMHTQMCRECAEIMSISEYSSALWPLVGGAERRGGKASPTGSVDAFYLPARSGGTASAFDAVLDLVSGGGGGGAVIDALDLSMDEREAHPQQQQQQRTERPIPTPAATAVPSSYDGDRPLDGSVVTPLSLPLSVCAQKAPTSGPPPPRLPSASDRFADENSNVANAAAGGVAVSHRRAGYEGSAPSSWGSGLRGGETDEMGGDNIGGDNDDDDDPFGILFARAGAGGTSPRAVASVYASGSRFSAQLALERRDRAARGGGGGDGTLSKG